MQLFILAGIGAACLFAVGAAARAQPTPGSLWMYVSGKDGIYLFKLDTSTGTATALGITVPVNTNFLAVAPDRRFVYGVGKNPNANQKRVEEILAWAIDRATGKLTLLNRQLTHGDDTCYVTTDPKGRNALTASYSSATVAAFPIGPDGRLAEASCNVKQTGSSIDPRRQTHAYAHSVNFDSAGRFAFAADLGADKIFAYRFDAEHGILTPNPAADVTTPPGSGPRHFTFDRANQFCYLVTEMGGTVVVYSYDSQKGTFAQLQEISALPTDFKGENGSAEVQIDPSGRYLYASNRLDTNFITIFAIDGQSGKLSLVDYQPTLGRVPRNFRIDPTGQFLVAANQDSNSVVIFRIDPGTGKLSAVGEPLTVPTPMCVKFVEPE